MYLSVEKNLDFKQPHTVACLRQCTGLLNFNYKIYTSMCADNNTSKIKYLHAIKSYS